MKSVRRTAIDRLAALPPDDPAATSSWRIWTTCYWWCRVQLPGNYVSERPSIERIAETLDKFEEDVLGASTATCGRRKVVVTFGDPIIVDRAGDKREATASLTKLLEQRVQMLLDKTE